MSALLEAIAWGVELIDSTVLSSLLAFAVCYRIVFTHDCALSKKASIPCWVDTGTGTLPGGTKKQTALPTRACGA